MMTSYIYTHWSKLVLILLPSFHYTNYYLHLTFFILQFSLADDGGIKVNDKMQTSVQDVYAAGDVCNASWEHAPHWLQVGQYFSDITYSK